MEVSREDILSMSPDANPTGTQTFKGDQLLQLVEQRVGGLSADAYADGVECEHLSVTSGGGWKKGKLRLALIFEAD